MTLVDNPQIKSAELLSPLPIYLHTYIAPFAIIWPIFARYFYTPELYDKHIGSSEWTFVWCGSIITLQSLVWLSTNWSVNLKALFTARKASKVEDAELIKVIPIANAGTADICKITRDRVCPFLLIPSFRVSLAILYLSSPFLEPMAFTLFDAHNPVRIRSVIKRACLFCSRSAVFSTIPRSNLLAL